MLDRLFNTLRPYVTDVRIAVLLVASALVWAFLSIADEMMEGETKPLDETVLLALRNPADRTDPLGPRWVEELARDVTALGSPGILTFIVAALAGLMWLRGDRAETLFLLVSAISGAMLSRLLKLGFERPRPDLVPHGTYVDTASFPSGHSMMAAVIYLTVGVLLARTLPRKRLKGYVIALAVILTLAVGVTRVFLGVHWPTDVLAGWAAGASWALICGVVAAWIEQRRR